MVARLTLATAFCGAALVGCGSQSVPSLSCDDVEDRAIALSEGSLIKITGPRRALVQPVPSCVAGWASTEAVRRCGRDPVHGTIIQRCRG